MIVWLMKAFVKNVVWFSLYFSMFKKRLLCFGSAFYYSVNIKVMPSWSINYAGISWTDLPVIVKSGH